MTTPSNKSVEDPWRVVDPIYKTKPEPTPWRPNTIDVTEIDFDRDLRVPQSCVFGSRFGSIQVRSRDINNSNDALRNLMCCLFEILEQPDGPALFEHIQVGFSLAGRNWLIPEDGCPSALLKTKDGYDPPAALYFRRQNYDRGMLRLIKLLISIMGRPGPKGQMILRRWGVVPMSR
jgi:hypothetical protein